MTKNNKKRVRIVDMLREISECITAIEQGDGVSSERQKQCKLYVASLRSSPWLGQTAFKNHKFTFLEEE